VKTKSSDTEKALELINSLLLRIEAVKYQDRQTLDDIFTDIRLVVRRTFGQENIWMHDLDLIRFAPDGFICNSEHYLMTGAWKEGIRVTTMLLKAMNKELLTFGPVTSKEPKITWESLWQRLPLSMWFALGSLILTVFAAGVALGQTTFIKELFGK
jgi:hypothetical protein